jgi:hypothetical protein
MALPSAHVETPQRSRTMRNVWVALTFMGTLAVGLLLGILLGAF